MYHVVHHVIPRCHGNTTLLRRSEVWASGLDRAGFSDGCQPARWLLLVTTEGGEVGLEI